MKAFTREELEKWTRQELIQYFYMLSYQRALISKEINLINEVAREKGHAKIA